MILLLSILAMIALSILLIYKVRTRREIESMVKASKARAEVRATYIGSAHGLNYHNPVSRGIWTTDDVK